MDDHLATLSLEPKKMVRALEKSGHHTVPVKNEEVSEVVRSARLCVTCQHSPSGKSQTQILTTV